MLLHLVSLDSEDPKNDYYTILKEVFKLCVITAVVNFQKIRWERVCIRGGRSLKEDYFKPES